MATAKITLIGFQNYLEGYDEDLFKYLSVPTGIDKDLLINNILLRGGEFEVLYSDPVFLQNMIGVWSSKWQRTMERWLNALSIEYNPLENYDRKEDWTDNGSKVSSGTSEETNNRLSSTSSSENENKTENRNNTSQANSSEETSRTENAIGNDSSKSTGSGTTTNTRSAFDASTYSPHDKSDTSSEGNNVSSSLTSADGKTQGETTSSNIESEMNSMDGSHSINSNMMDNSANSSKMNNEDKTASLHSGRIRGNIGVTTSQQMLQAELDIDKWNLYEEITDLFLNEFCIYLY